MSEFLTLIVELIILGLLAWIVDMAPFIDGTFKTFIRYIFIVIAAIIVIAFLYGLVSGNAILIK